jgi:peptidoglycan/LPS O-acetylase OafA/YrhL
LGHSEYFLYPLRDGHLGVATFFVVSGFLITHLLLGERNKTGEISLGKFYLRRSLRIFPPCYAYLAVIGILSFFGFQHVSLEDLLSAATYIWNYNIHTTSDILGHLWSLSLEEQFYLLWPACVVALSKRACLRIAIIAVCLAPLSRLATYALFPAYRGHIGMMLHTRVDTIMIGCILALLLDLKLWTTFLKRVTRLDIVLPSTVFLLLVNKALTLRLKGEYDLLAGITAQGICCGIVVLYSVWNPQSFWGKVLNNRAIRHVGIISYSLYLWQQLFTLHGWLSAFPWNVAIIFGCAELSYLLVEKPSFYLRDRLLQKSSAS